MKPRTLPRATSRNGADGTHSSSMGRDAAAPPAPDHRHVVTGEAPDLGAHARGGRPKGGGGPRRVRDARLGDVAPDRDAHLAALAREALQQRAADRDQVVERGVGGPVEVRGDVGERGGPGQRELDRRAEIGRREGAVHQLARRRDGRRPRGAHTTVLQHPETDARLLRRSGRLEAAPVERHGGALDAAPNRVRPPRAAPGVVEQPLDHAATSPPTSASSMRTWGAPSVTGSGPCPALPQPPPIWFQRKSPAMRSIRSSVWKRFPASTTSLTSSAGWPSRIIRP